MSPSSHRHRFSEHEGSDDTESRGGTMQPPDFDDLELSTDEVLESESGTIGSLDDQRIDKTVDLQRLTARDAERLTKVSGTFVEDDDQEQEPERESDGESQLESGPESDMAVSQTLPMAEAGEELAVPEVAPGPTQDWSSASESSGTWSHLVIQPRHLQEQGSADYDTRPDYEVLREIGRGAMGVVYAARQASINRIVAVKMLSEKFADEDRLRGLFLGEAVVTGELEHPNIVPIYDLAKSQQGALFYSMKEVKGIPWDKVIGEKSEAENLEIWMRVADAVAFAHDRGVIHRDLKPENVMLGRFGEVLLMDWGIAVSRSMLQDPEVAASNGQGGTPAYMAPEMATEGPLRRIGPAADIYLLGALLFEIVTGSPPHTGADVYTCMLAAAKNKIVPTDKTGELLDIARKAMAGRPKDRYASVEQLQQAVRDYRSHTESVKLSARGRRELRQAETTGDYNGYQQAILAFREAVALWPENRAAAQELEEACIACAREALRRGDYDLGLSVLDSTNPEHRRLIGRLRTRRLVRRGVRMLILALVTVIIAGTTLAAILIDSSRRAALSAQARAEQERRDAILAKNEAIEAKENESRQRQLAEAAKRQEELQRQAAEEQRKKAEQNAIAALKAQREAEEQRKRAEEALEAEEEARKDAEHARDRAVQAQTQEAIQRKKADAASYRAQIALAKSQIDSNVFNRARAELDQIGEKVRQSQMFETMPWEYRRLRYMLNLSRDAVSVGYPIKRIAIAPDGSMFAVAGQNSQVSLWSTADAQPLRTIQTEWDTVSAVAFSPDGKRLITASNGQLGGGELAYPTDITAWDLATGEVAENYAGRDDSWVLSLATLPDGGFVTGSVSRDAVYADSQVAPGILQRWSRGVAQPVNLVVHQDAILDVTVSPDGATLVSVDRFGRAVICRRGEDGQFANLRPTDRPLVPHDNQAVYAARFSPDGKWLATAGGDGRVLLWSVEDLIDEVKYNEELRPAKSLIGHQVDVLAIDFSRDGNQLISAGEDGTVRVWRVEDGSRIATLRGHSNSVSACVFHPIDATTIVSGDLDGEVRIWDLNQYQERIELAQESLVDVSDARFSPDGLQVAVAHREGAAFGAATVWRLEREHGRYRLAQRAPLVLQEGHVVPTAYAFVTNWGGEQRLVTLGGGTARFWNIQEGHQVNRLSHVGNTMSFGSPSLSLSRGGDWIIAALDHQLAAGIWHRSLWNAQDDPEPLQLLDNHRSRVRAVAISPSGGYTFSGDERKLANLWRANAAAKRYEKYAEVSAWGSNPSVALFTPDGTRVFVVDAYMIRQFDVRTGRELEDGRMSHMATVRSIAITPDGKTLLAGTDSGQIAAWDITDPGREAKRNELITAERDITAIAVSADGRKLLDVSSSDSTIRISRLMPDGKIVPEKTVQTPGYRARSATFYTADGSQIFTAGEPHVALWDLTSDPPRQIQVYGPAGATKSVDFSADGTRLVTAHGDGQAIVWDLATRRVHCRTSGVHTGGIQHAVFSPDDKFIYTAGADGHVQMWDADTGKHVGEFCKDDHDQPINRLAFSSDGNHLATAVKDGSVVVWNLATRDQAWEATAHTGEVTSVAYSYDGQWLISGGADHSAYLYRADGKGEPVQLMGHTKRINSVAFSRDGLRAITASDDGTTKLWAIRYKRPGAGSPLVLESAFELLTFKEHGGEVMAARLSSDSRNLLSATRDGGIWIRPSLEQ